MNELDYDTAERLTRIETRLAQLMKFCGADIQKPNTQNGLLKLIADLLKGDTKNG